MHSNIINRDNYPTLWSFVQLVWATMDLDSSLGFDTSIARDDLDRYEVAMIELSARDFLVLAGVIDDESRFDELRGSAVHEIATLLA